jgi:hypothetical protein
MPDTYAITNSKDPHTTIRELSRFETDEEARRWFNEADGWNISLVVLDLAPGEYPAPGDPIIVHESGIAELIVG